MRRIRLFVVLIALSLLPSCLAAREIRVALVIGNGAYPTANLVNPKRDADAVARALQDSGFDNVDIEYDLGRAAMLRALEQFEIKAGKADWALVYYAGHGFETGGANYLLPIDAPLDEYLAKQSISLSEVEARLAGARKLRIIILDACRDDPFPKHSIPISVGTGLAAVPSPAEDSLVAFSAGAGQTASDGESSTHSPYAAALLKNLATPDVEVGLFFRRVRADVLRATNNEQIPAVYESLSQESLMFHPLEKPSLPDVSKENITSMGILLDQFVADDDRSRGELASQSEKIKNFLKSFDPVEAIRDARAASYLKADLKKPDPEEIVRMNAANRALDEWTAAGSGSEPPVDKQDLYYRSLRDNLIALKSKSKSVGYFAPFYITSALVELGRTDLAEEFVQGVFADKNADGSFYSDLAKGYSLMRDYNKSLYYWDKAIKNTDNGDGNIGIYKSKKIRDILLSHRATELSDDEVRKYWDLVTDAISLSPDESEPYFIRGVLYTYFHNFDSASRDLGFALQINPNSGEYRCRGLVQKELGNFAEAASDFSTAARLSGASTRN